MRQVEGTRGRTQGLMGCAPAGIPLRGRWLLVTESGGPMLDQGNVAWMVLYWRRSEDGSGRKLASLHPHPSCLR